ncbi:MAG: sensor histidine kinase, partial [Lachnospiraceae bacterium]|nr:sensor histidine kinase [Lachnospiraceae bacterium]
MKDLLKIYRRYILTAASICVLVLIFNLLLLFFFLLNQFGYKTANNYASTQASRLSDQLTFDHGEYVLSKDAQKLIDEKLAFAMLIDQEGQVIWSRHLPDHLPRTYSLTQVASFSRWYLEGYPVKVHVRPDGLFVTATPLHSMWKHTVEFKEDFMHALPLYLLLVFLSNLLLIFVFALLFGHRFYISLKPLVDGIDQLTGDKVLTLPEQGIVGNLAGKLNKASAILVFQRQVLEKRDHTRTNWISGVSHDIRTPLSLILGFSDNLAESPNLNSEEKKEAASIRENSLLIKRLIEDLNLTSRLEYNYYPLRIKEYHPASL